PTIANFQPSHLRDRPEEIACVMRLARIRHLGLKYLRDGEFLRPPRFTAPEIVADMSRLSIYAGQRGGLTEFQKRLPSVVAGAWRAPDGDIAIALASVADEELRLGLAVDPGAYGLSGVARVWRIDEAGRKPLGQDVLGQPKIDVDLAPRGACLIELTHE
ncbi:MAG: hypothetical protein IT577_00280, partial [Verrucomicrobiae bacterium]|nr:hypothetical protein [Verrucomicrobiae bacterium]